MYEPKDDFDGVLIGMGLIVGFFGGLFLFDLVIWAFNAKYFYDNFVL